MTALFGGMLIALAIVVPIGWFFYLVNRAVEWDNDINEEETEPCSQ